MRIPTFLFVALAVGTPCQTVHAAEVQPPPVQPPKPDVVFVDLPVMYSDGTSMNDKCPFAIPELPVEIEQITTHRIFFDQNGGIFWNDEKVADDNLDGVFERNLVADGRTLLQFYPSENTPAGVAINTLKRIASTKFPCFGFVGNGKYEKIWKSKTPHNQPWELSNINLSPPPDRKKAVTPITIQIMLTDDEGRGFQDPGFSGVSTALRCRVFFGPTPVSSDELVESASKVIWNAVEQAGGAEKLLKSGPTFPSVPDAILLTTPSTPWRCVGGTVVNLQMSGFIAVGFALMPEDQ